jgi:hypothetical protein
MKTILLTIKLTVLSIFLSAQVTFIPHELNIDTLKPWIITCGDLDGDNHEDILLVSSRIFATDVVWFQNNGISNFGNYNVIPGLEAECYELFDFNADSIIDILGYTYPGELCWYPGLGQVNFGPEHFISSSMLDGPAMLSDMDNDGLVDIVSYSSSRNSVVIIKNLGGGFYTEIDSIPYVYPVWSDTDKPFNVFDINMDNFNDVVVNTGYDSISTYMNNGSGICSFHSSLKEFGTIFLDSDFDNDGDNDMLVIENGIGYYHTLLYYNNGIGYFDSLEYLLVAPGFTSEKIFAAALCDINLDGYTDIMAAGDGFPGPPSFTIGYYLNHGDGSFDAKVMIEQMVGDNHHICMADFDKDGDPDFVFNNFYPNSTLTIYENTLLNRNTHYICDGDSLLFNNTWIDSSVVFIDTLQNALLGDSIQIDSFILAINPQVQIDGFSIDSIANLDTLIPLPIGTPAGGNYFGSGVDTSVTFNPYQAGLGESWIYYEFSNPVSECYGIDSTSLIVFNTMNELPDNSDIVIYPNPAGSMFKIESKNFISNVEIITLSGKVVYSKKITLVHNLEIDLSNVTSGSYIIRVECFDNNMVLKKLLVI